MLTALLVMYMLAVVLSAPKTSGPLRTVVGFAAISVVCCAAVMGLAWLLPGIDSRGDLALRRSTRGRWWTALLLTAAATGAAVAMQWISQIAGASVAGPPSALSQLATHTPAEIPADIVRSIHTSVAEELLFFAVPLALGALAWRQAKGHKYLPVRMERACIAALTALVIVGLRVGVHLYWGFPVVLLIVLPWMLGTWMIFRVAGTVWPLIIGHTLYDIFVLTLARSPDMTWVTTLFGVTLVAGTCVIFAAPLLLSRRTLSSSRMWRVEEPRRQPSVGAVSEVRGA